MRRLKRQTCESIEPPLHGHPTHSERSGRRDRGRRRSAGAAERLAQICCERRGAQSWRAPHFSDATLPGTATTDSLAMAAMQCATEPISSISSIGRVLGAPSGRATRACWPSVIGFCCAWSRDKDARERARPDECGAHFTHVRARCRSRQPSAADARLVPVLRTLSAVPPQFAS